MISLRIFTRTWLDMLWIVAGFSRRLLAWWWSQAQHRADFRVESCRLSPLNVHKFLSFYRQLVSLLLFCCRCYTFPAKDCVLSMWIRRKKCQLYVHYHALVEGVGCWLGGGERAMRWLHIKSRNMQQLLKWSRVGWEWTSFRSQIRGKRDESHTEFTKNSSNSNCKIFLSPPTFLSFPVFYFFRKKVFLSSREK